MLVCLLLAKPAAGRSKEDVVVMKNGDHFTGEIKKLERGQLYFKASYMADSVRLDWAQVVRLESKDGFRIQLGDGRRYSGAVTRREPAAERPDDFVISTGETTVEVPQSTVVLLDPADETFWDQLKGGVDYGFNFTSGNNQTQSTLNSNVEYPATDYSVRVKASSVFSGQTDGSSTARHNGTVLYERLLTKKWYAGALGDVLKSDQQQLNLRTTLGAGLGRHLIRTNRTLLTSIWGVAWNRERYAPDSGLEPQQNNAEGLAGIDFAAFRFDSSEIAARLLVYPSITRPGRVRVDLTANFRLDLWGDLYWNFSFYENFDSAPPTSTPKNDLGVSSSFGWSF